MSTLQPQQQPLSTLGEMAEEQQEKHLCAICNKSFKKVSHYNRHINEKHTQNRDYVCKQKGCNKTFKRGSHLKRHMISHTNDKNYSCEQCIMKFGYKHHLDRHVKLIHLKQRLECLSCDLKFMKKKAYNKHMSKFHEENSHTASAIKNKFEKQGENVEENVNKTKVGLEQSVKPQQIYQNSQQSEQNLPDNQRELYRCHYNNCLSAFYGFYQFRRHLNKIHSQS